MNDATAPTSHDDYAPQVTPKESANDLETNQDQSTQVRNRALTNNTDWTWVLTIICIALGSTMLPYLIGFAQSSGRHFMWLGYNIDDSGVYLSWMRQAADGSTRAFNLFTTDPQKGMLLNPLFMVMGWIGRLTHIPLIGVFHLFRLIFGAIMLALTWWLISLLISNVNSRRYAFLCVCFASGFGWLPLPWSDLSSTGLPAGPIDNWQPEAITYLSLYLSPLFCFSLALQVAIIGLLWSGEQKKSLPSAAMAGVCGFTLGLTHTYDIVSLSLVWCTYILTGFIPRPVNVDNDRFYRTDGGTILRSTVAGIMTLPAVGYIYQALQTEATFNKRMNVVTASPEIQWVLLGYGLTLILAVTGIYAHLAGAVRSKPIQLTTEAPLSNNGPSHFASRSALRLLICWTTANILAAYLPVSKFPFQRKMLQGTHFPIAILAGVGIALLLQSPRLQRHLTNRKLMVTLLILLLGLSNLRFIAHDLSGFKDDFINQQRPYLNEGELEALDWISKNTPADSAVQPLPWIAKTPDHKLALLDFSLGCVIPGRIHRSVYCGHWGETPDYPTKVQELIRFLRPDINDAYRKDLLTKMKVRYLIYSQRDLQDGSPTPFLPFLCDSSKAPAYLRLIHTNKDADVYEVTNTR